MDNFLQIVGQWIMAANISNMAAVISLATEQSIIMTLKQNIAAAVTDIHVYKQI